MIMKLFTSFFLLNLIMIVLNGCLLYKETSTNSIYRSSNSKKDYLTINVFSQSHCGCTDVYAQNFSNGKLTYEFYYGCTPFFSPKKVVYTYENNNLIATTTYKVIDSTNFDTRFDSLDLFVLKKIDSFRTKQNPTLPEYKLCSKNYMGLVKIN